MKRKIIIILLAAVVLISVCVGLVICGGKKGKAFQLDENQIIAYNGLSADFSSTELTGNDVKGSVLSCDDATVPREFENDLYRITTSAECTSVITVTLDVPSELMNLPESRTLLLGVGSPTLFGDGTVRTTMQYKEVTAEDGKVTATVDPSAFTSLSVLAAALNGGGEAKTDDGYVFDIGLTDGEVYFKEGHFKVYFPGRLENYGVGFMSENVGFQIVSDLEKAYEQFTEGNGFTPKYKIPDREWPMSVYISDLGDNAAEFVISKKDMVAKMDFTENAKYGYIAVNRKHIETGYDNRIVAPFLVHEFFHFVQLKYTSKDFPVTWFNEATSSYYEYMDKKLTPDSLPANEKLLFDGVYPKSNTAEDGYARSSLLYYLTGRYGSDYILENYKLLGNGKYEEAFAATSNKESPSVWVADFYQKHLGGELFKPIDGSFTPYNIYNDLKVGKTLGTRADLTFSTKVPSGETYPVYGKGTFSIPGYGARFLRLDVTADELAKLKVGDSFRISCDNQNITLSVFVIERNSETKKVTNTLVKGASPTVFDAKSALEAKKMLLVCAVNTSKEQANAEIKVQPAGRPDYSGMYTGVVTDIEKGQELAARISVRHYITIGNESDYNVTLYYTRDKNEYSIPGRFTVKWPVGTINAYGDDEYVFSVDDSGISLTVLVKGYSGNDEFRFDVRKNH